MQQSRRKNFLTARNLFFLLTDEEVEEIKLFSFKLAACGRDSSSAGEITTCSISIGNEENVASIAGETITGCASIFKIGSDSFFTGEVTSDSIFVFDVKAKFSVAGETTSCSISIVDWKDGSVDEIITRSISILDIRAGSVVEIISDCTSIAVIRFISIDEAMHDCSSTIVVRTDSSFTVEFQVQLFLKAQNLIQYLLLIYGEFQFQSLRQELSPLLLLILELKHPKIKDKETIRQ